ncbi:histidine kinase [Rubrivirga sp. S365]|uniref:Histidine kinase n=1 Tax=Rubrivirga litoralis TaxID=3075598 RepID=A0ABU3BSZ7_9BACT|nr:MULTISPECIES: histidine kinase [unclassified Rubrivirga]MDT0632413.1 histidine kinase [Rubrivirga sp. F394]MDT7855216.1 histidine kinase [Rubrivirga sp. S365]
MPAQPPRPPRPRLTWRGVGGAAAAYAVLALGYSATIEQWAIQEGGLDLFVTETLGLLPRSLFDYGLKGLLTLPVWWVAVRRLDGRPRLQVAAHVVLGPLWVWAWYVAYRALAPVAGYTVLGDWGKAWDVFIPALVYVAQFGTLHAIHFVSEVQWRARAEAEAAARHAELERAARDAQLSALRAQMDPHFLFNTLNSVAASVPPEQGATRDLVARLAGLVRYTLAAARRERVLLREELDFVRDYLALEGERMGGRLRVQIDADDDALDVPVPPMLVQPLVENAVRHGLAPTVEGGLLRVEARRVGGAVHVLVRDDGAGPGVPVADLLHPAPVAHGGTPPRAAGGAVPGGVGLANTDARLRALFGTGLTLAVPGGDGQARGLEARFTVPADGRPAPPAQP